MTARSRTGLIVLAVLVIGGALTFFFISRLRNRKPPEAEAIDPIDRRTNLPMVEPIRRDLAEIKERGQLIVLAPYNSTSYFLYRGEPLGYEYELLQAFAKEHGVPLKIIVVTDRKSYYPLLNAGDGDIVAARLIPTEEDKANVAFTRELVSHRACARAAGSCRRKRPTCPKRRRRRFSPALRRSCRT